MTQGAFYLFKTESDVDTFGPGMLNAIKMCIRLSGAQFLKHETYSPKRTLDQNSMHCGLCRNIAEALRQKTGLEYDVDYLRTKTKRKFGITATQIDPDTGKAEPFLVSTTQYSKAQFSKLIEGTLAWAAVDLGLTIDRPKWADEWRA